ncbi:uncharacterized protein LOC111101528 isoform X1 [Crassostrea virginica]
MLRVTVLLMITLCGKVLADTETCEEGQIKGLCDCNRYSQCLNGLWQREEDTPSGKKYADICRNCTEEDNKGGCSEHREKVVCNGASLNNDGNTSHGNDESITSSTIEQTTDSTGGDVEMCPCECEFKEQIEFWKNKPPKELDDIIESKIIEMKKELQVNLSQLTSTKIKKISAPDSRMSASMTGYVGVVFIVLVLGFIVILDFPTLVLQVQRLFRSFKAK